MNNFRPNLIILAGPTATGKTYIAIELCRRFNAEIINADSVQVYRGLDIGSAKPTLEERKMVPFHLVDIVEPWEQMNAARWAELAEIAIADIHNRKRKIFVVGGTGLYIKALLFKLIPTPPLNKNLRATLQKDWEHLGGTILHAKLKELDPISADRIHPADRQRILRALEIIFQTKQPLSEYLNNYGFREAKYSHLYLGLTRPQTELNIRIEQRCQNMWRQGLVEEVKKLLAQGLSTEVSSLSTLGYRQAVNFIKGKININEALAETISRTKSYSKRQLTWFRKVTNVTWFHPKEIDIPEGLSTRIRNFWGP